MFEELHSKTFIDRVLTHLKKTTERKLPMQEYKIFMEVPGMCMNNRIAIPVNTHCTPRSYII
jgi:hypothetical protein